MKNTLKLLSLFVCVTALLLNAMLDIGSAIVTAVAMIGVYSGAAMLWRAFISRHLHEVDDFAAFAAFIGKQPCLLLPAGGLSSGYTKTEIEKWTEELARVVVSGVEKLTEKMGVLPSGQKIAIVFVIDGDTWKPGRYTEAVLRAAKEASAAGHYVIFLVATSPCMQWGQNDLEDFQSFGFPVYRVSVSYANINRTAAFLEGYAYFGNDFYGQHWRDGEKFPTTFGYFFLAAYVQCAVHTAFAACPNVVIMQKTYLVDQTEQLERVSAFMAAYQHDNNAPAIKGGITFLEMMLASDARMLLGIKPDLPTLEQLIGHWQCCEEGVHAVCEKVPPPQDAIQIHEEQVQPHCTTIICGTQCGRCCVSCMECEHVFVACSEHVMDTVPGEEALECPRCKTVAMSAYDNVNGEQADYVNNEQADY